MSIASTTPPRFLRLPEVLTRTGISKATTYALVKRGEFPRPHHIGTRVSVWLEADVTRWIEAQARA